MAPESDLPLSKAEMEIVKKIAARDGVSEEVAASRLVSEALARRVKKRSGKVPARVYGMGKR